MEIGVRYHFLSQSSILEDHRKLAGDSLLGLFVFTVSPLPGKSSIYYHIVIHAIAGITTCSKKCTFLLSREDIHILERKKRCSFCFAVFLVR